MFGGEDGAAAIYAVSDRSLAVDVRTEGEVTVKVVRRGAELDTATLSPDGAASVLTADADYVFVFGFGTAILEPRASLPQDR